jgi:hypothetical protein
LLIGFDFRWWMLFTHLLTVRWHFQVPSHYAPNYPLGHPRRGERGVGYSTLPMPPSAHVHSHTLPHHTQQHVSHPSPPMSPPQVGMVHPIPHNIQQTVQSAHPQSLPPPPPANSYTLDHNSSMPREFLILVLLACKGSCLTSSAIS